MTNTTRTDAATNQPKIARLSRERVVRMAIDVADRDGLDGVSMRNLADRLNVVPMAIYKHVANKDELLDAMVDVIVSEIAVRHPVVSRRGAKAWKGEVRERILAARHTMLMHPWARHAIESRTTRTPTVLSHLDSIANAFVGGGISPDLTHHSMHAIGSRVWGFTQDVFDAANENPTPPDPATLAALVERFPSLAIVAGAVGHDQTLVVGPGCDDQFEFEFALDLLLDGIDRLHKQHWTPHGKRGSSRQPTLD